MVISGKSKNSFDDANIVRISEKYDPGHGEWRSASTNEEWSHFWREIEEVNEDTIVVNQLGELEIQEDDRGEYVEVEQHHGGIIARGDYMTRFRPFFETGRFSQDKKWLEEEEDVLDNSGDT